MHGNGRSSKGRRGNDAGKVQRCGDGCCTHMLRCLAQVFFKSLAQLSVRGCFCHLRKGLHELGLRVIEILQFIDVQLPQHGDDQHCTVRFWITRYHFSPRPRMDALICPSVYSVHWPTKQTGRSFLPRTKNLRTAKQFRANALGHVAFIALRGTSFRIQ